MPRATKPAKREPVTAAGPAVATKAEAGDLVRAATSLLDVARRLVRLASAPATTAWQARDLHADAAALLETAARGLRLAAGESDQ